MVAQGRCQAVGGVKLLGQIGGLEVQHAAQHGSHLLFAGIAIACNRLLDLPRSVLHHRNAPTQRSRQGHTLCTAKLQHRLHVLPEKWRFGSHFIRIELINQLNAAVENALQFQRMIVDLRQVQHPHGEHLRLLTHHTNDAVAHDCGAGVNAHNDALCCFRCQCDTFAAKGSQLNTSRRQLLLLLRALILLAALGWLWYILSDTFETTDLRMTGDPIWLLVLIGLLPVNLGLEALKWKLLTRNFAPSSYITALKAVLHGSFYALFTPNRLGDGIGRWRYLPPGNKTRGTYAFANGSIAQTLATLIAGSIALLFSDLWLADYEGGFKNLLFYFGFGVFPLTLLILVLYTEPGWMRILREWIPEKGFIGKRIHLMQQYSRSEHRFTLLLSMLRYTMFTAQYIAALHLYGFDGELNQAAARIAIIYLIATTIPTAALAEFGIRESLAVLILPTLGMSPEAAFSATFVLWLTNLCLPAVVGSIPLLKSRKTATA